MNLKLFIALPLVLLSLTVDSYAATTVYSSDEVTGTGLASRTAVDALNDVWQTAVEATDLCLEDVEVGSIVSGDLPVIFDHDGVQVQVELLDMDGGTYFGGTLASTQGFQASTTSTTMQDSSPKPQSLYSIGEAYYNETSGAGSTLNGLLLTFSEPLIAFGSYFGDVETRTDGNGMAASVRLFDEFGVQVGADEIIDPMPSNPTFDQSQCGAPTNSTFRGCGNRSTRWMGFTADVETPIKNMIVTVGDDDTIAGSDTGFSEHLSMIGATTCAPRRHDLTIEKIDTEDPIEVGNDIEYIVTITNNDTINDAMNVIVSEDYDDVQTTLVSAIPSQGTCDTPTAGSFKCDIGTIVSEETQTITVTVTADTTGTTINNVTVTASGIDNSPGDNEDSESTTIQEILDIPVVEPPTEEIPSEEEIEEIEIDSPEKNVSDDLSKCNDGEIGNRIWIDLDRDGKQDHDEPGLEGIQIKLKDDREKTVDRTKTGNYGKYSFDNLEPGEYKVVIEKDDLDFYVQTYDPNGSVMNNVARIDLGCDENVNKVDFGFIPDTGNVEIIRSGTLAKTGGSTLWQMIMNIIR